VLLQGIHELHRLSRLINHDPMGERRDLDFGLVLDLLLHIGFAQSLYVNKRNVAVDNNFG